MKRLIGVVLLMCFAQSIQSAIKTEEVTYKAGNTTLKGFMAYDDSLKQVRPGVLVVHEWWGHNEYSRKRARMLAELGYVAFALDMYGDGKTADHPGDAGSFSAAIKNNLPLATERFVAALERLKQHPMTDKNNIAAVGYCFGGTIVLEMARGGAKLKGVASFHGGLGSQQIVKKGDIKARILVLTGADDKMVPDDAVTRFRKEMDEAGAMYQVVSYPGAKHAFTNPEADVYASKFNIPLGYHKDADEASWQEMKKFLTRLFQ